MFAYIEHLQKMLKEVPPDVVETEEPIPDGMSASKMEWVVNPDIQRQVNDAAKGLDM